RYANMADFAQALQGWLRGAPLAATTAPAKTMPEPGSLPPELMSTVPPSQPPTAAAPFADLESTESVRTRQRPARRRKKSVPLWAYAAGGAGVVLAVVVLILLLSGR